MTAIVLLALCTWPRVGPVVDVVDSITLEHFYDENGRHVFDQFIFRDFYPEYQRELIRAWRLRKDNGAIPLPLRVGDQWRMTWLEAEVDGTVFREVRSRSYAEEWSQVDSEMAEREVWPIANRRGLTNGWQLEYKPGEPVPPLAEGLRP